MRANATRRGVWLADLAIVAAVTAVAVGALLASDIGRAVEWLVGVPFLVFLPGYAVIAALFPEQPGESVQGSLIQPRPGNSSPSWTARLALSLVMSAVVVGGVGVAANYVVGIQLAPIVAAIGGVTLLCVAVATVRRAWIPLERRANPFAGPTLGAFSAGTTFQTVSLAVALLVLVGTVAFVGAVPMEGESYSESYLLTENENGTLVASDHPTEFVAGDGHPIHVGLENHEHRTVSYEVVVLAQDVDANGTVTDERQIDRFDAELEHGESTVVERNIAPTETGDGIRLRFQVYKDIDPANAEDADQTLQLWVDVVDGSTGDG